MRLHFKATAENKAALHESAAGEPTPRAPTPLPRDTHLAHECREDGSSSLSVFFPGTLPLWAVSCFLLTTARKEGEAESASPEQHPIPTERGTGGIPGSVWLRGARSSASAGQAAPNPPSPHPTPAAGTAPASATGTRGHWQRAVERSCPCGAAGGRTGAPLHSRCPPQPDLPAHPGSGGRGSLAPAS